jgi:hypothetical protein
MTMYSCFPTWSSVSPPANSRIHIREVFWRWNTKIHIFSYTCRHIFCTVGGTESSLNCLCSLSLNLLCTVLGTGNNTQHQLSCSLYSSRRQLLLMSPEALLCTRYHKRASNQINSIFYNQQDLARKVREVLFRIQFAYLRKVLQSWRLKRQKKLFIEISETIEISELNWHSKLCQFKRHWTLLLILRLE